MKTIKINGRDEKVTNTLSCGPGEAPHTYELTRGRYVYRIADVWYLQIPGQFKILVSVA
jgi:hypothetical protein